MTPDLRKPQDNTITFTLNTTPFEVDKDKLDCAVTGKFYDPWKTIDFCDSLTYTTGLWQIKEQGKLPKRTIINDNAVILIWHDDTKTVVKRHKEDKKDPIKGFLWAFFQAKCGMSKTKANKYLESLLEEKEN